MKESVKAVLYGSLDAITLGRGVARTINGEVVRFPTRYARYYEPHYETTTFKFLRENCPQGGTFLDCGAHIGLFSVTGARLVGDKGKVCSFEPTPSTGKILKEVVRLNNCQGIVEVRPEAISKTTGTATFFATGNNASNANSLVQTSEQMEGITVPTISIDEFVAKRNLKVDVIKIDVEGSELDALHGAYQTINEQRPALSLGLHPNAMKEIGATLKEVWEVLAQHDLRITYEERLIDSKWFVEQTNIFDVQGVPKKREASSG